MRKLVVLLPALVGLIAIAYAVGLRSQDSAGTPDRAAVTALPTPASTPAPSGTAPAAPAVPAIPGHMDARAFWGLMARSRAAAGNDTGRQSQLLERQVGALPPAQAAEFERLRHGFDRKAYTWDLWGAAYVIEDGCSDDCFRDFRAYLISLGPRAYQAALRDPDSLASVVQDPEEGDWENADDPAPDDSSDLSGRPSGQAWDDEHAEQLVQRYPRLAARFR